MDERTELLKTWAIHKIKSEYIEDVALLVAVHGHSVNGDGHGECFDYFIPATKRGYELSQTFIIDGIGYDLYPRSWERTEATAMFEEGPTLCLANAEIVYSCSKEEEERFISIRNRLFENMKNKDFMYKKGLEQIDIAMQLYSSLIFQEKQYKIRMITGYISNYLAKAIAYRNGTYLDWYDREKMLRMSEIPDHFVEYNASVLQEASGEKLKKYAFEMLKETREFYAAHKKTEVHHTEAADYANLADWYQELSLTFRRMRYYCDTCNAEQTYTDACYIQNELEIVQEEFGLKEMDLMGSYKVEQLEKIKDCSSRIEQYIINEIDQHGIRLKKYDTLDDFLADN